MQENFFNHLKKDFSFLFVAVILLVVFSFVVPLSDLPKGAFFQIALGGSGGGGGGGAGNGGADAGAGSCGASDSSAGACDSGDAAGAAGSGGDSGAFFTPPLPPPTCSVYTGQACSSATNACGQPDSGTIQCSGACFIHTPPPPLPQNHGYSCPSPPNACGMRNFGTIGCSNDCSAQFPPSDSLCDPQGLPVVTLLANPSIVAPGGNTALQWYSQNATSCIASNAWSGTKPLSGNQTMTNLTSTRSYTLTCTGPKGTASETAVVTINSESTDNPQPPGTTCVSLSAAPLNVPTGGSTKLTWNQNLSCTPKPPCTLYVASTGQILATSTSGTRQDGPITTPTKRYTLACGSGETTITVFSSFKIEEQ